MSEEATVNSPHDLDDRFQPVPRETGGTIVICYVVMCLLCCICLAVRFYGCGPDTPEIRSVYAQDIYASFDFPYVSSDGETQIIQAGERLAKAGVELDEQDVQLLSAYRQFVVSRHMEMRSFENFAQMFLIMSGMLLCFLFCLHSLRPRFFLHRSNVVLCITLAILHFSLVTGCSLWMRRHGYDSSMHLLSLLPLCLVPGLATHLLGTRVSICLALLLTSMTALLMEGEFQFVLFQYSLICSLIGIATYRRVRRYRQLFVGGIVLFVSVVLLDLMAMWHGNMVWPWGELGDFFRCVLGLSFWHTWEWGSLASELRLSAYWSRLLGFALINSCFTTVMMMVLPKVFECFFDVISPISLQALSSLEHPLLERMRKEARGTYEHCMAVGQMAGDAAEAIGADKTLARMCGYFHDIGKLCDPRCFAENAYAAESPHRYLSPYESSNRIRAHVKQGAELARKYHLQRPLLEAILCHHGNDLVVYFYRKAIREAEASNLGMPDEKDFRYEAALPHRSEAVIVEIADICEAASRAELAKLDLVDRKTVKAFVDKLVMSKMSHGQFADADMTLAEFTTVCESMVDSLCSRYHQRPKYTEEEVHPQGPSSGLGGSDTPNGLTPAATGVEGVTSATAVADSPAAPEVNATVQPAADSPAAPEVDATVQPAADSPAAPEVNATVQPAAEPGEDNELEVMPPEAGTSSSAGVRRESDQGEASVGSERS